MERIEGELRHELDRLGIPAGSELVRAWPELVGEAIARNAWPARLSRSGSLRVNTSSATWAFELTQLAPKILSHLRERFGNAAPMELRFAPGPLPSPGPTVVTETSERSVQAGEAERAAAEALAAPIADDELRKLVARAAAASLARAASKRPF